MPEMEEYIVRIEHNKNEMPFFTTFSESERALKFAKKKHKASPNANISLIKQITRTIVLMEWNND